MTPIHEAMLRMGQRAKDASRVLALVSEKQKNAALLAISQTLPNACPGNFRRQCDRYQPRRTKRYVPGAAGRLRLTPARIDSMASGVLDVIGLPDPVGRVLDRYEHPNGMQIEKVSVPLGVIAVIFEARPNVTSDAAALCLKSGNAVILRGGKEAIYSNSKICALMRQAVVSVGLPEDVVSLVADMSRESAQELMRLNGLIDVLIPRGGAGLIRACVQNATVPVIETGAGNCHIYIDQSADIEMAAQIVLNAKTSRPPSAMRPKASFCT
jgi:glutamate-5-semialdehyde dehydrogenase